MKGKKIAFFRFECSFLLFRNTKGAESNAIPSLKIKTKQDKTKKRNKKGKVL